MTILESPENDETPVSDTDAPETENTPAEADTDANSDTFPRAYVEELRKEAAGHREKAKTADARTDELSKRLHTALVAATGRLQDPSDLAYAAEHLDDPEALAAAIDALVEHKPHLKARKPSGDVGQGIKTGSEPVSLLGILKNRV